MTWQVGRIARLALAASAMLASGILIPDAAEAGPAREGVHRQHRADARPANRAAPRPAVGARAAAPTAAQGQQRGIASYYAHKFNGRRTASGVRLDQASDTAAHRTLPMGTVARVTNLSNGRSAIVTIRDRGPFIRGRILDLTLSTATRLDMRETGVALVSLETIFIPETRSLPRRRT